MMDYEEIKQRLLRYELEGVKIEGPSKIRESDLYDPNEVFATSARQLALLFMRTKVPQDIVRSRIYSDEEDIGPALPAGKVLLVTVEFVPEQELLDAQD